MPEVGLGTAGYHAAPQPLRRGFEAGMLFFDTAESYGSETVVAIPKGNSITHVVGNRGDHIWPLSAGHLVDLNRENTFREHGH